MEIQVTLLGALRDKLPRQNRGQTTLTLAEGATVADILSQLQLATTTASAINGTQIEKSQVLKDGDAVQLFRQLGGG